MTILLTLLILIAPTVAIASEAAVATISVANIITWVGGTVGAFFLWSIKRSIDKKDKEGEWIARADEKLNAISVQIAGLANRVDGIECRLRNIEVSVGHMNYRNSLPPGEHL